METSEKEKWVINMLEDDVVTDISFVTQVCCTCFCSVIHQVKVGVQPLIYRSLFVPSVSS